MTTARDQDPSRLRQLATASALLAFLCALVAAGCGSASDPHAVGLLAQRSVDNPPHHAPPDLVKASGTHSYKAAPVSQAPASGRPGGPPYPPVKATRPGRMVNGESSPFSTALIGLVRNGWEASDHRRITGVWAGASGDDSSTGRFAILRQGYIHDTQDVDTVDIPGAGALKIIHAPLGKGPVQSWAQSRGELRFESARGVTGTLFLKGDTVKLDR